MLLKYSFFIFFAFAIFPFSQQEDAPIIQLFSGKIKGEKKESRDDKDFFAYRGIPYATAKRFETPQKPQNWSGIRDAEEYGKECMQFNTFEKKVTGSENCHFINVFSPQIGEGLSKKLLPVMVFINGNFMDGTSEIYRAHYFMDEEVVVVTFNYRLNIFGFLSTGDEIIPGNLGLKDQVMALQWVNQNIRKFSGDPNLVTIFGAEDGATSVGLLMLSPLSKGLFRKAITQSGSSLKLSTIQKNPKQAAQRIARVINCGKILVNVTQNISDHNFIYENSSLLLECLRLVDDPKKLAEIQKDSFGLFSNPLAFFGPVIETPSKDAFLTEHPYSIISSGRQARVPWITGINSQEGLIFTGVIQNDKSIVDLLESNWLQISPKLLKYDPSRTDITRDIRTFYLSVNYISNTTIPELISLPSQSTIYPTLQPVSNNLSNVASSPIPQEEDFHTINFEEQFEHFTDMFTDRFYASGMYEAVKMQAQHSPVYFYNNGYKGQYSLVDVYTGKSKEPTPALKKVSNWFKKTILRKTTPVPKHLGVCNGDELPLLFKYPDLKIKEGSQDYAFSKSLVKLWVQFSKDETKMVFNDKAWLPLSPDDPKWMKFDKIEQDSGFETISQTFINRMKLWSSLKYLAPFDQ